MFFSTLTVILFPLCIAIQLGVPSTVNVDEPFSIEWFRDNADPSTFSLFLGRGSISRLDQSVGPLNVDSHGAASGQTSLSVPDVGTYLAVAIDEQLAFISVIETIISVESDITTQGSTTTSFHSLSQTQSISTSHKGNQSTATAHARTSLSSPVISRSSSTHNTSSTSSLPDGTSDGTPRTTTSNAVSETSPGTASIAMSNGKKGVLVGAIVGPVASLLLLCGILFICRRRSQKSTGRVVLSKLLSNHDAPRARVRWVVTPFTEAKGPPIFHPGKPSSTRPSVLANPSRSSLSEPSILMRSAMTERQNGLQSHINELIARNAALEASNENARNGIADLRAEIKRLGRLLQSDWALGLTDEPPPSYGDLDITRECGRIV